MPTQACQGSGTSAGANFSTFFFTIAVEIAQSNMAKAVKCCSHKQKGTDMSHGVSLQASLSLCLSFTEHVESISWTRMLNPSGLDAGEHGAASGGRTAECCLHCLLCCLTMHLHA